VTGLHLGPQSRNWLSAVGIHTLEDLQALGAVEAWQKAKVAFPDRVSLNLLYALQGLLLDCPWNDLPPGERERLQRAVES